MRRLIRIELLLTVALLATWVTAQAALAEPSAATAGATTEYVPFVSDFPRPAEPYVPFVTDFPAAPAPASAPQPVSGGTDWGGTPVEGLAFALALLLAGAAVLVVRRRADPRPLDC